MCRNPRSLHVASPAIRSGNEEQELAYKSDVWFSGMMRTCMAGPRRASNLANVLRVRAPDADESESVSILAGFLRSVKSPYRKCLGDRRCSFASAFWR